MLRCRTVNVKRMGTGYGFRIIGHEDDLEMAENMLVQTVPPIGLRSYGLRRWIVHTAFKDRVEELFPGFLAQVEFEDRQQRFSISD